MRKHILTTAAVAAAMAGAFAAEPAFGTFTDTRDGQTYKTVKIGEQTWMAQNLNYKPQTGNSWCYYCYEPYCNKYGRLYDWETAKTVCPIGWKLPDAEDWYTLVRTAGGFNKAGKKLKSKSGWSSGNGTDDYGFSALPGGCRFYDHRFFKDRIYVDGIFGSAGKSGNWWTPSGLPHGFAEFIDINDDDNNVGGTSFSKTWGLSVRCIADAP